MPRQSHSPSPVRLVEDDVLDGAQVESGDLAQHVHEASGRRDEDVWVVGEGAELLREALTADDGRKAEVREARERARELERLRGEPGGWGDGPASDGVCETPPPLHVKYLPLLSPAWPALGLETGLRRARRCACCGSGDALLGGSERRQSFPSQCAPLRQRLCQSGPREGSCAARGSAVGSLQRREEVTCMINPASLENRGSARTHAKDARENWL